MNYKIPLSLYCLAASSFLMASDIAGFDDDSFEIEATHEIAYQDEEENFQVDTSMEEQLADPALDTPWKEEQKKKQLLYSKRRTIGKVAESRKILADSDEESADDENMAPADDETTEPMAASNNASQPEKPHHIHFSLYGDFLYWQASNTNALWALKGVGPTSSEDIYLFHFNWEPGFRIGAAFKTTWENLTFDVNWVKFHTIATNTHQDVNVFNNPPGSHNPDFSLYSLPADDFSSGNPWRVRGRYKIEFNQIDFTFRKGIPLSKNFTLSPFGGLRAVISEHTLNAARFSTSFGPALTTPAGPFNMSIINVKDYLKCIGLLTGVTADLKFGYGFGFYFGGDIFIGYGPDKTVNTSELTFAGATFNVHNLKEKTQTTRMMYDIFTGFSWDTTFWNDRFSFLVSAGYELHAMENTPMFIYNGSGADATFNNEPSKTTTFQGLTIRGGIGF